MLVLLFMQYKLGGGGVVHSHTVADFGTFVDEFIIKCKNVWVWKNATCDAAFGFQKNLYCMSSRGSVIFATRIGHLSCEIGIKNPSKNL